MPPVEARILLMIGLDRSGQSRFGRNVSWGQIASRAAPSVGGRSPTTWETRLLAESGAAAPGGWLGEAVDTLPGEA
jgi:hypothetical protein